MSRIAYCIGSKISVLTNHLKDPWIWDNVGNHPWFYQTSSQLWPWGQGQFWRGPQDYEITWSCYWHSFQFNFFLFHPTTLNNVRRNHVGIWKVLLCFLHSHHLLPPPQELSLAQQRPTPYKSSCHVNTSPTTFDKNCQQL